jgi:hypothetical protein
MWRGDRKAKVTCLGDGLGGTTSFFARTECDGLGWGLDIYRR